MFWRFGGYANISTIDTILDKPDATLEELLDESDLIQELKQHNTKLIEYLRDENALRRLLEYVVAPTIPGPDHQDDDDAPTISEPSSNGDANADRTSRPQSRDHELSEEDRENQERTRQKYAYVACEVLSSETWSINEALMENRSHLRDFWRFLKRSAPLDPLQAGYFTKVNETLLDKKTEDMLEFFKSLEGVVGDMLQHVDCPMVMDLLLKIISLEKADGGQGIVDVCSKILTDVPNADQVLQWLQSQHLIPTLLSYLSIEQSSATQTSAGDFLKAIITISANASQNEQSCIGPNDLTRQLVSEKCIRDLIGDMLHGGNPLTVGVGIIIEVIRKNNSDYDPDVEAGTDAIPSSRDPIYLGTLLRLFAEHVPQFMRLILSPTYTVINEDGTTTVKKRELKAAFGEVIEPLGFDRFKTCELMAELLHCSNMGLLNECGSERFVKERDKERDRLKAQGALLINRQERSGTDVTDDSTGYPQSAERVLEADTSADGRKLEVANGGEEDGFEDVAVSGVLNDEVKDDFDEKIDNDVDSHIPRLDSTAPSGEQASIGGDAEKGMIDGSPSAPPEAAHKDSEAALPRKRDSKSSVSLTEAPLSPTSAGLTAQVQSLHFDRDNDTIMASPSDPDPSPSQPLDDVSAKPRPLQVAESDRPIPGLAPQDPFSDGSAPPNLSPHPEDHPAPLFASKSEQTSPTQPDSEAQQASPKGGDRSSHETLGTGVAEEGDSSRSVLMSGNEMGLEPQAETDIDGSPVVGDFLKMMFVEHRVVPTILDFFFRFPWNNFLHNVVYDVVQQVFNGPMDRGFNRTLAIDLFDTGRVTERIFEGQQRSDKAQTETKMRLGYMGHLTLIAEEVVKFTERHPPEFLSSSVLDKVMHADWIDYVERTLAETRERDNAILGGVRPDISVGPRQAVINSLNAAQGFNMGPSAALANAGLTGGGAGQGLDSMDLANGSTTSGGSFGLGSGSLLSGFGSSSDEEDEEMEEITDDADRDGQLSDARRMDPFSAHLSSSEEGDDTSAPRPIPNIPPPPPPLNIPPSRARRQLAARLALNKARKEEEEERARARASEQAPGRLTGDGAGELGNGGSQGLDDDSTSSSDDDDDDEEEGQLEMPVKTKASGTRRPSTTTEAKQRSALDDDDDDDDDDEGGGDDEGEVVHIRHEARPEGRPKGEGEGGDMVEVERPRSENKGPEGLSEAMSSTRST
ncbi:MAG: hypothetical protein M1817_005845 [Caeruleum heppii]|nr:MAG: hypothetical protein M1817_005845 [Caeruleum heppii]